MVPGLVRFSVAFLLVPLAAALLGATPSAAQTWTPAGFGGAGYFNKVHFDTRQSGTVWLASDVAGVFRSTDAGDTWTFRSLGLGNLEVDSFAVDPFDSNHLWAGCGAFTDGSKSGIYASTDAGVSWSQLPGAKSAGISFRRFWNQDALAPDSASKGTLLSGSMRGGVFRSTDGGQTFAPVLAAPLTSAAATIEDPNDARPSTPYPAPVAQLVFDPSGSGTVWAAFDGAGVYVSPARGTAGTWLSVSTGLPADATVKAISFSSGALYAAVGRAGVYRSTNGGAAWSPANGDLPLSDPVQPWVSSVSADPSDPRTALITLVTYIFRSVWKTTDGGATWRAIDAVQHDAVHNPTRAWATWSTYAFSLSRDPSRPARVFMTDYWSVQRSDDGGDSWTEKVTGAQDTCVSSILLDVDGTAEAVLVGVWDAGILRSTDGGVTWAATRLGDGWVDNHSFRLAAGGGGRLFATFDPEDASYLLRSTDHGLTWTRVFSVPHPPGGGMFVGLAVDPSNPATIYLSQEDGQVWKSTEGGLQGSFAPTSGQPADSSFVQGLAVDPQGRVFAGTRRGGLFRSTDGGASWTQVLPEEGTVNNVVVAAGAVWAAGGSSNLHRSTDGGVTWQRLTNFTATPDTDGVSDQGMAIAIDPAEPRHILFSRLDTWHPLDGSAGIVESTDGGTTWNSANQGLGLTRVFTLAFGSVGTVWAGTSCGGTWVRRASSGTCTLTCAATAPSAGVVGQAVAFSATATPSGCPSGTPSYAWLFGDGAASTSASPSHAYAVPETYAWSVTVSLGGSTCSRSGSIAISAVSASGPELLLPVVLDVFGVGGSHYTTELTLVSRAASAVTVTLRYTAASGGGSGTAALALASGEIRIIPDAIAYLRSQGLQIPSDDSSKVGSLRATFGGAGSASEVFLGGRTSTPGGGGTFGLFYPAVTLEQTATAPVWVYGLQQSAAMRSNLAVVNRGDAGDVVTLRIRYYGNLGVPLGSPVDVTLGPGEWRQLNRPLEAFGVSAGYVKVERLSGSSRFLAYGVLNDAVTSDGSYVGMSY